MIINQTVGRLDYWLLKLEYAHQGVEALINGRTKGYADWISDNISYVYAEMWMHRWQYHGIGWNLFERPLLTRRTFRCLDYCFYRLKVIYEELDVSKVAVFTSMERLKRLEHTLQEVIVRLELETDYYSQPWWERWKENEGFIGFIFRGLQTAIDEKMAWNWITRDCFDGWVNQISSCSQDIYRLKHNPENAKDILSDVASTLRSVENELSCVQYYFSFPWWKRFRRYENIGKDTLSRFDKWILDIEYVTELISSAVYNKDFSIIPENTTRMGSELRMLADDMRSHLERYSVPWYLRWLEEPDAYGKR